jgi:hypothetical protein
MNLCTVRSEVVSQIRLDYLQSQGIEFATTRMYQITVTAITSGMTLLELGCYITIFYHCYKNDNGRIKSFLPKDVTRKRNTRNAITFMGQIYAFMVEFTFMAGTLVVLLVFNMEVKYFGSVAKIMEFGLVSAVEVLTSPSIRKFNLEKAN